jgi:hypothetical protein
MTIAGQKWGPRRTAQAAFQAQIVTPGWLPFFVEIRLPDPDSDAPEVIRKEIAKDSHFIEALGKPRSGWVDGTTYQYEIRIYSDQSYSQLLDSLEQPSVCYRPPNDVLDRLK